MMMKFALLFISVCLFSSCKTSTTENLPTETSEAIHHSPPPLGDTLIKSEFDIKIVSPLDQNDKSDPESISEEKVSEKIDLKETKKITSKNIAKVKNKPKKPARKLGEAHFDLIEYDFGEIESGDIIDFKFVFTNEGKGPLDILSAKPSCGCTVPSFPFVSINPGEQGHIGVSYNSVGKSGEQTADIIITTNGKTKIQTLQLVGLVKEKEQIIEASIDTLF